MKETRRSSIKKIGTGFFALPAVTSLGAIVSSCGGNPTSGESTAEGEANAAPTEAASMFFSISLAQWSLNHSIFGKSRELGWEEFGKRLKNDPDSLLQGTIDPLDFPSIAKNDFGLDAVEYVNTFYFSKAEDMDYLSQLKQRCDDNGVKSVLIMCDAEGNLGDSDEAARIKAVENHYKWINAAKYLGCHSIRVNAAGQGTAEEVKAAAVDGLGRLTEYGAENEIGVIVENHGGYSSNGQWLADVIKQVGNDYCGTLPDFGNFCIEPGDDGCVNEYDRYKGMAELMPFAKGVSAKSKQFDQNGNETSTDFTRMLQIVKDSGFNGYIDIEYEGSELSEPDGIRATKALLERVGKQMS
ncbi:MAG: sugar phosphate isomerase/epimerase family protein [Bacteroidota bacterium]